jgi:hypothetical protein
MKENRHSQAIPADVVEQAIGKFQEVKGLLDPYLSIGLTAQDRRRLPIMGPKTLDFVSAGHEAASNYPDMLPPHITFADFDIDFTDARQLYSLQTSLDTFQQSVSDLVMVAGSEALQSALAVYAAVKLANAQKVPGAKALYEKMRDRYPSSRRRSKPAEDSSMQE